MSSGIDIAVFMDQWYNYSYTFVNNHFWANGAVQPEPGFPAIGWDGWLCAGQARLFAGALRERTNFYMGSSLAESWTKSRKQVLPQLDNGEG
jgi:predicted secreted acid phosphatase